MCIIICKPTGVALPKDEWIHNSESNNGDGIGICLKKKGGKRVFIKKDFKNGNDTIAWIRANVVPEDELIVHFRWATSGKKDEGNRHPFPITLNKKLMRKVEVTCKRAVAHNGVMTQYSGHKKYSDTQKFTMDMLARPAIRENLWDAGIQRLLKEYIGTDKLAILDYEKGMLLIGDFEKDEGCYFSNDGYKRARFTGTVGFCQGSVYPVNRRPYHTHYYNGGGFYQDEFGQRDIWDKVDGNENKLTISDDVIKEECDGCGGFKHIKLCTLEDNQVLYLCKKCRKTVKRYGVEGLSNKEDRIWRRCDACNEFYPPSELRKDGENEYCEGCVMDLKEYAKPDIDKGLKQIIHEAS